MQTKTNAPKLDVDVSEASARACDLHELQQHRGSKSFTSSRHAGLRLRLGLACEAFSSLPVFDGVGELHRLHRSLSRKNAFSYLGAALTRTISKKNNP